MPVPARPGAGSQGSREQEGDGGVITTSEQLVGMAAGGQGSTVLLMALLVSPTSTDDVNDTGTGCSLQVLEMSWGQV